MEEGKIGGGAAGRGGESAVIKERETVKSGGGGRVFRFPRVAAIKSVVICACGNPRRHAIGGGGVAVRDVTSLYPIDAHCRRTMRGEHYSLSHLALVYFGEGDVLVPRCICVGFMRCKRE